MIVHHLGPLTEGHIFRAKNFVLYTGNENPSRDFQKGSDIIWSCCRELTPTK